MNKRIRVAYVATYDSRDVNSWSGTGVYMGKTLEKYIGDVEYIGNLNFKMSLGDLVKKASNKFLNTKVHYPERTAYAGEQIARQIESRIKSKKIDLIFSPGTIPIAGLNTNIPIVFWTDATFVSMIDYYFHNLSKETIKNGNLLEARALSKCKFAIYSSDWAADSAINYYGAAPEKVKVISFGANIEKLPNINSIKKEPGNPVKLLFVGKEWERKGGDVAVDTVIELEKLGINSSLTIVGCKPPLKTGNLNINVYEYLDKRNIDDKNVLNNLYSEADFFLLPTRQECTPIVFCEANSFGLPIITTNTGGLPTMIKDYQNGFKLPLTAGGCEFAAKIKEIITDRELYTFMRSESRRLYDEVLNWDSSGIALKNILQEGGIL